MSSGEVTSAVSDVAEPVVDPAPVPVPPAPVAPDPVPVVPEPVEPEPVEPEPIDPGQLLADAIDESIEVDDAAEAVTVAVDEVEAAQEELVSARANFVTQKTEAYEKWDALEAYCAAQKKRLDGLA